MSGEDPDYAKRDLWQAIERGEPITWTAKVQIMQPEEADPEKLGFDPFDVTKVWPRGQFPVCCSAANSHLCGRAIIDSLPDARIRQTRPE